MNIVNLFVLFFILACKLICHKKCLNKIITDCSTRRASQVGTDSFTITNNILTGAFSSCSQNIC